MPDDFLTRGSKIYELVDKYFPKLCDFWGVELKRPAIFLDETTGSHYLKGSIGVNIANASEKDVIEELVHYIHQKSRVPEITTIDTAHIGLFATEAIAFLTRAAFGALSEHESKYLEATRRLEQGGASEKLTSIDYTRLFDPHHISYSLITYGVVQHFRSMNSDERRNFLTLDSYSQILYILNVRKQIEEKMPNKNAKAYEQVDKTISEYIRNPLRYIEYYKQYIHNKRK